MPVKLVTRKKRLEKVQDTARKLRDFVAPHYETLNEDERRELLNMMDALDDNFNTYIEGGQVWDSQLIDVVLSIGNEGIKCRSKEISTFESVMGYVRDIMVYVVSTGQRSFA